MGEIYEAKKRNCTRSEDEELLLSKVICDEHELLFLDSWLREILTTKQ